MRFWAFCAAILCGLVVLARPAEATVSIQIDLTAQRMQVTNGAGQSYSWPVSTARSGFVTPRGSYRPYSLQTMHYSRKYDMTPMPHSIFFHGGYAIHGTTSVAQLGRPASHGCIRLAPGNARALFMMVKAEGARISISGTPPGRASAASATRHRAGAHAAMRVKAYRPMVYAPYRQAPQVQRWYGNPAYYGF